MQSAFGIIHKAEPTDLGDFREKKRKAKVKAFFERPDISAQIDEAFKPSPHRAFSEDAGKGISINYKRPDGSVTGPKPHVAEMAPATAKKTGKGLMIAGGTLAAAAATPAIVGVHRKNTRAARWNKQRKKKTNA